MDSETVIAIKVVREGETGQLEVEIVVSVAGKRSYRNVERLSGHDIRLNRLPRFDRDDKPNCPRRNGARAKIIHMQDSEADLSEAVGLLKRCPLCVQDGLKCSQKNPV